MGTPAVADNAPNVPVSTPEATPAATPAQPNPVSLFNRETQREKELGRFSRSGRTETKGAEDPFSPGSGQLGQLMNRLPGFSHSGTFEAEGTVASTSGRVGGPSSLASGEYNANALRGEVSGSYSGEFKKGTVKVAASTDVTAAAAEAQFKGKVAGADVNAHAFAGGTVKAEGQVQWDPAKGKVAARVGGEAFLGARVGGEIRAAGELGAAGARGEAWAGLGVTGKASAGYDKGRLRLQGELGGALGLGFKVGGSLEIDTGALKNRLLGALQSLAPRLAPGV